MDSKQDINVNVIKNGFYATLIVDNGISGGTIHSLSREDLIQIHQTIGDYLAYTSK